MGYRIFLKKGKTIMILTTVYQQTSSHKWVKKWECSNCEYDELDNVGFIKPVAIDLMIGREKLCPKCKSMGKDDHQKQLLLRIDTLTEQRSNIDVEIESLTAELESVDKQTEEA